jgi:hypothetical protein
MYSRVEDSLCIFQNGTHKKTNFKAFGDVFFKKKTKKRKPLVGVEPTTYWLKASHSNQLSYSGLLKEIFAMLSFLLFVSSRLKDIKKSMCCGIRTHAVVRLLEFFLFGEMP